MSRTRVIARLTALVLVSGSLAVASGTRVAHADDLPAVSIADVTAVEGDYGTASIRVPVTLSNPSGVKVKVPYTVSIPPDGTLGAQLLKGTLTFAAGNTSKFVNVKSVGDTNPDGDLHVQVILGTPILGTATLDKAVGEVTLTDDDSDGVPPSTMQVSIGSVTMNEGNFGVRTGYIPVLLSAPATVVTKVGFAIDCSTASLLTDVKMAKRGTLTFPIGTRSKYIGFKIDPDVTPEQVEAITQSIVSQAATAVVLDNRGDAEINDDDGALPAFSGHPVPNLQEESLPSGSTFNAQAVGGTEMVDVNPAGAPGNVNVAPNVNTAPNAPALSYDGRYAAFSSAEPDIVPGDTNGMPDIFVRDRQTGTTELVSRHQNGTPIAASEGPVGALGAAISANGRDVVYATTAPLDPSDSGSTWDLYLYDRVLHTTELVSKDNAGNPMGSPAFDASVSANGRYVSFVGRNTLAVFVRDRQLGTTTQVYDTPRSYSDNELSANGRYLVVPTEAVGCLAPALVVVDLADGSAERVDVTDDGEAAVQDYETWYWFFKPSISGDGRYVSFNDDAWNLFPGLTEQPSFAGAYNSTTLHVYVRDLALKSTTMAGMGADGSVPPHLRSPGQTSISWDGNVVVDDQQQSGAGVAYDRVSGATTMFGVVGDYPGELEEEFPYNALALSGDGRYVGFFTGFHNSSGGSAGHDWIQRLR